MDMVGLRQDNHVNHSQADSNRRTEVRAVPTLLHGRRDLIIAAFLVLLMSITIGCASTELQAVAPPPTETGTAAPSATPPPTLTLTPDIRATNTPIALSDAPFPLSLDLLRARTFEGSDFEVVRPLTPGVNYDQYVVSYLSDGLKIYALLTVPQGPIPPTGFPVIIFNHGYIPPSVYRTTERYEAYVDAFARQGYIVVKSDYRGHGLSEGDPEGAYGSPGYVIDVLNAVASVRRFPQADPNRIGMWGHSMGGYITLRAMVIDPTIRAGVIWAGVVLGYEAMFDRWFRRRSSSSWRAEMIEEYGSPEDNPAFWRNLSANNFLTDLGGPLQIHHGTGDATVPYDFSITLDEEMRAAGMPSELILYQNDDHNIAQNRDTALTVSYVFFDAHVKNAGR